MSGGMWGYEVVPRMGGAAGEAYTNPLASSGMDPAAVLAREAIQNSVDAHDKGEKKVAVDFVCRQLLGEDKRKFVTAAALSGVRVRSKLLGFKEPNCLARLDDDRVPLSLLFISDHNTTGLEGNPSNPKSKFFRFLLTLGDGGKEHDEHGTGGSYGYGKSVYSANSGIQTIFAYSRTKDGNGNPISILFGCGYYKSHQSSDKDFTGRAWFGMDETPKYSDASLIVVPLLNEDADRTAAELGFSVRGDDDLGTSVLIVDSMVESKGIQEGVEDWWWPRLISHQLDVRVVSADGTESPPRPRKREDLRPFLEAFDIAVGKSPANDKSQFRKALGKDEGHLGLRVLDQNEDGQYTVPDDRLDSVALIRRPLMVVHYHRKWLPSSPAMAGAFVSADEVDDILRSAEPPAHDRWDPAARRLHDSTGERRTTVERILAAIKRNLKAFQKQAAPPPPPRPKRLTMLERTLASFLTPSKKGTPPRPDASSAPISLTYDQEPRASAVGGQLKLTAAFAVKQKPEATDVLSVRVRVTCPVMEDGAVGDSLILAVEPDTGSVPVVKQDEWFVFDLLPDETAKFTCETSLYDPQWTVRFIPEVEAVTEGEFVNV